MFSPSFPALLGAALLICLAVRGQVAPPTAAPTQAVPTFVERMPTFRSNGSDSLLYYVQRTIRYPREALRAGAQGRVFISFVVNQQGQVTQVRVSKGVHPALDAEALRIVATMPTWRAPGFQNGQPVDVAFTIPVAFKIDLSQQIKHQ